MTSQEFKSALLTKSPHYALSNQKVFDALANKLQRSGQYSQFGALYELYIYGFFIGMHINSRIELPERKYTTDFAKMGAWKRESSIINFILLMVFSRSEEVGFDWNELEQMDEKELEDVLKMIVTFIEEYAHGGLCYLKERYENDDLEDSQYLFIDLLTEITEQYGVLIEDKILYDESAEDEKEAEVTDIDRIKVLIEQGEGSNVEFKSTLRVNMHTNKPDKSMEHSCMKTLGAFFNSNGGTLIIGVDDKKQILGLNTDFGSFNENKDQLDEFQKHLDNLIEAYFNNGIFSLLDISYPTLENKIICVIRVKFSAKGQVILSNKHDNNKEEFYIRRSASTKSLSATEMISYVRSHWS